MDQQIFIGKKVRLRGIKDSDAPTVVEFLNSRIITRKGPFKVVAFFGEKYVILHYTDGPQKGRAVYMDLLATDPNSLLVHKDLLEPYE